MDEPKCAGNSPIGVELEPGKKYAWCTCGLSVNQPFCDGKHKGTKFVPTVFEAGSEGTVYFCACKKTNDSYRCDGSHNRPGAGDSSDG